MKNLFQQVQERTNKNLVKKSNKRNVCDSIHDLLYKKSPMKRIDIIGMLTVERLKDEYPNLKDDSILNDEQLKRINQLNITCKNGLDTAVCQGHTASSYCSNPKYSKFELIKDGDYLTIVDKK